MAAEHSLVSKEGSAAQQTYLLDTQVLIWLFSEPGKLSQETISIVQDSGNRLVVSAASFWEIAIKLSISKIKLPMPLSQLVEETLANNIEVIGIEVKHILSVATLPFHHRDPFDRLLICQAMTENWALVSADSQLHVYDVLHVW